MVLWKLVWLVLIESCPPACFQPERSSTATVRSEELELRLEMQSGPAALLAVPGAQQGEGGGWTAAHG